MYVLLMPRSRANEVAGRPPVGAWSGASEEKQKRYQVRKRKRGLTTAGRSWQCSRVRARARTPRGRPSHAAPRHTKQFFFTKQTKRNDHTINKEKQTLSRSRARLLRLRLALTSSATLASSRRRTYPCCMTHTNAGARSTATRGRSGSCGRSP